MMIITETLRQKFNERYKYLRSSSHKIIGTFLNKTSTHKYGPKNKKADNDTQGIKMES